MIINKTYCAIHWIATYHVDCITRNHVKKKDHMLRWKEKSRKNLHGPLSLNLILHDTLMIVIKLFLTVMQEVILFVEETGTMGSAYYGWSISQQNAVQ